MFCCWQVSRELAQVAREPRADGKVVSDEQEEAGSRCTMVEGIEAEAVAIIFVVTGVVQLLSKLCKLSFWVL